ncbi:MAG TPA: hypothetical protein VN669_00925 [Candidatus Acidoferrales bacterium]|nr:hypothetical protein [Candidatus Acidoferrales bacterium]
MKKLSQFALLFAFALLALKSARAVANNGGSDADAPPAPAPASISGDLFKPSFGIVAKVSMLGIGGDVGTSITPFFNVRGGFNGFSYSHGFNNNGIHYDGTLRFRSVEALVDITPLRDWFHISPGVLVYNGNQITARASVPGGQNFDLGGASFKSSASDPVHGSGQLVVNKAAPMVMFGFGNPIPHSHHVTIVQDFGVVFQGTPKTTLNLAGTACDPATGLACVNAATDPAFQSQIKAEQDKINKDTSIVKFYPVASIGIGIRF